MDKTQVHYTDENTLHECKVRCQNQMNQETPIQLTNIRCLEADENVDYRARSDESVKASIVHSTKIDLKFEQITKRRKVIMVCDHLSKIKVLIHH